jgi:bacterioferritin (cytochrome b1)
MSLSADALVARLQEDLTRKANSFAEYVRISSPYIAEGQQPLCDLVARQAMEERAQADSIARLIVALGGVPAPGIFDEGAADLNYLRITHLAEMLLRTREKAVAVAEQRVEDCAGHPEARQVMLAVLECEERHLRELREELARHGRPAAPSQNDTSAPESADAAR